ncbi:MAG: magnesium chelatase [Planctomycetota bacterium]
MPVSSEPTAPPDASALPRTVRELRETAYRPKTVKRELRDNVIRRLAAAEPIFDGVVGYDDTVVPQLVQGLLSEHDVLLLGLRGQAKTRLLRMMVQLLDEWIPVIDADGLDIPDDPLAPTTRPGRRALQVHGDDTAIRWVHRTERFHEKLATPDVTIADLIGEVDLVKHAEGRHLADEATMHFGLVPRSNRGLFVLNELPDLAPRIQVGLFNVLEERDVQIRGYPIRLDLDVCLMFSANPEDYTNRGRIVTPLKDRLGSVVRTHYPPDNELAMRITRGSAFVERGAASKSTDLGPPHRPEVDVEPDDTIHPPRPTAWAPPPTPTPPTVHVPPILHQILEEMIRQARTSPHVNQASGVSVRASIACLECLVSAAEMRALRAGEYAVTARPCDLGHIAAAMRGKIELMLADESGEAETAEDRLIHALLGEATKQVLGHHLDLEAVEPLCAPFERGLTLELSNETSGADAAASIRLVDGLESAATELAPKIGLDPALDEHLAVSAELVLDFLYVNQRLSKRTGRGGGYRR